MGQGRDEIQSTMAQYLNYVLVSRASLKTRPAILSRRSKVGGMPAQDRWLIDKLAAT